MILYQKINHPSDDLFRILIFFKFILHIQNRIRTPFQQIQRPFSYPFIKNRLIDILQNVLIQLALFLYMITFHLRIIQREFISILSVYPVLFAIFLYLTNIHYLSSVSFSKTVLPSSVTSPNPALSRTLFSISKAISGLSCRKILEFSLPCPIFSPL